MELHLAWGVAEGVRGVAEGPRGAAWVHQVVEELLTCPGVVAEQLEAVPSALLAVPRVLM